MIRELQMCATGSIFIIDLKFSDIVSYTIMVMNLNFKT